MGYSTQNQRFNIRWFIRRDLADMSPWLGNAEEIKRFLRQRNNIGMVADIDDRPVAYMLYTLHPERLELRRMVVQPEFRRKGLGRILVEKLASKLTTNRKEIVCRVPDDKLSLHLFLKKTGFTGSLSRREGFYLFRRKVSLTVPYEEGIPF